jgi:hypothetical protein
MEIGSVAVSGYVNSGVQTERQQQVQSTQQQPAETREVQAKPVEETQSAPSPVANAQGQTTGRIINVTA